MTDPIDVKARLLQASTVQKQGSIAKVAAKKRMGRTEDGLPATLDDFNTLVPDATQGQKDAFSLIQPLRLKQAAARQAQNKNEFEAQNDRSAGELLDDAIGIAGRAATGIEQLAISGGQSFVEQKFALPQGTISRAIESQTGTSPEALLAAQNEKISDKYDSDFTKADKTLREQEETAAFAAIDAAVPDEEGITDDINRGAQKFAAGVESFVEHPQQAISGTLESVPLMIGTGFLGRAALSVHAANVTAKAGSKAAAQRFLQSKAGQKAINKVASRTGVATTAVTEGVTNGMQVQGEILGSTEAELSASSDRYREMRKANPQLSHEAARRAIAEEVGRDTTLLTGLFAGIAGKVSGAGAFEAKLIAPGSVLGNKIVSSFSAPVKEAASGFARESVEESLQGAAGQFSSNFAKQKSLNSSQDLGEGVIRGASAGFSVGGLMGASAGGGAATIRSLAEGSQEVSEAGSKLVAGAVERANNKTAAVKKEKAVVDLIKRSDPSELAAIRDVASENYDPETALNVMLDSSQLPDKPTTEYVNELNTHYVNAMDKAQTAVQEAMEEALADPDSAEKQTRVRDLTNTWKRLQADRAAIDETLPADATPQEIKTVIEGLAQQTPEAQEQTIASFFGSMDNATNEDLDQLKQTGALNTEQTKAVNNRIVTNNALHKALNTQGVNKTVIEGTEGSLGYVQYLSRISKAISNNSREEAQKYRSMLTTFVNHQKEKAQVFSSAHSVLTDRSIPAGDPKRVAAVQSLDRVGFKTTEADPHLPAIQGVLKNIQQEISVGSVIQAETTSSFNTKFKGSAGEVLSNTEESSVTATALPEQTVTESTPRHSIDTTTSKPVVTKAEAVTAPTALATSTDVLTFDQSVDLLRNLPIEEQKKLSSVGKTLTKKHASEVAEHLKTLSKKDRKAIQADAVSRGGETKAQPSSQQTEAQPSLALAAAQSLSARILTGTVAANSQKNGEVVDNLLAKVYEIRDAKTHNVLQNTPEFFSEFRNTKSETYASLKKELSKDEFTSLRFLAQFEKQFSTALLEGGRNFPPVLQEVTTNDAFKRTDPMKLWLKEDKTIDPNMASQMAVAAFQWLGASGASSVTMTPESINMALGRTPDETVAPEEFAAFQHIGLLKDDVEHSMGTSFISALNIRPRADAPSGFNQRMEQAAGQVILATLMQLNYMDMNVITGAQKLDPSLQLTSPDAASSGAKTYYARVITRQGENGQEPSARVQQVIDHHKGGNSTGDAMLQKVFNADLTHEFPYVSVEDIPKVSGTTVNTSLRNSQAQRRAVEKHQTVKHTAKADIWKALEGFSERQVQRIFGAVGDIDNKNINEQAGIRASNEKIARDLKNAVEFRNTLQTNPEGLSTPFYYGHEIWKNLRIGMKGAAVNIQNSKVARSLYGVQRHEISTPTTSGDQLTRFLLAAAEAMGIKLLNTDTASIQELQELLASEDVAPGLRALVRKQAGEELTKDGKLAVVKAVEVGGEKGHSFEALVALAAWQTAESKGEANFSHSLSREVDGVNNGVVFAMLQMMPDLNFTQLSSLLNRGGVFFDKAFKSYADFKQNSVDNDDLYEVVAKHWNQALRGIYTGMAKLPAGEIKKPHPDDMSQEANVARFASLYKDEANPAKSSQVALKHLARLVGKANRNLTKNPLMVFIYGAGLTSISRALTESSVSTLYSDISGAINEIRNGDPVQGTATLKELEAALNGLLKEDVVLNINNAKTFTLTKAQVKWLNTNVALSYGSGLDSAFDASFGSLRDRRDGINKALKNTYVMYKAVFDNRVKERVAQLGRPLTNKEEAVIEKDLLAMSPLFKSPMVTDSETNSGINPTGSINQKQGTETDKVHQAYSFLSVENKLPKGMPDVGQLSETQQTALLSRAETAGFKPAENQYETRTKFFGAANKGSVIRGTQKPNINNGDGFRSFVSYARKKVMSDTGVRGPVNAIHSMDAATMSALFGKFDILNVHDAIYVALDQEQAAVEEINKAFVNTAFNYDFPAEVLTSLLETKKLFNAELRSTDADLRGTVDALLKADDSSFDQIAEDIVEYTASTKQATTARQDLLSKLEADGWVSQYNNNTRGYDVSKAGNPVSEAQEDAEINSLISSAIEDVKQSGGTNIDLDSFAGIPGINVSTAENSTNTPMDMFNSLDGLGNVRETTEHKAYLADLLTNVYDKAIEPFQIKLRTGGDTTHGAIVRREGSRNREVYLVNANQGSAHGLQMSSQETYVHELTHAVIEHGLDHDSAGKREVLRLYRWAKENLKPEAFIPAGVVNPTQEELNAAQARWDYIFSNTKSRTQTHVNPFNGETETTHRSNYLHEFMTFGLTNAAFMKNLGDLPPIPNRIDTKGGVLSTLFNVFRRILAVFDSALNRTTGKDATQRLNILAQRFANTEENYLLKVAGSLNISEQLNDGIRTGISKFVVDPLVRFANTKLVKENRFGLVREAGGLLTHATHTETAAWGKALARARRRQGKTARNFLDHVVREFIGQTEDTKVWHAILALSGKLLDQNHKAVATNTASQMLGVFDTLTKAENHGLTKAVLKTDLAAIYNDYVPADIIKLLKSNSAFLTKEVAALEAQLGGVPANVREFYGKHIKSTASLMVLGKAIQPGTYMNAHNMARAYGVAKTGPADKTGLDISTVELDAVESILNKLITLEAIRITGQEHKDAVATVVEREAAKGGDSGVNFLIDVLNTNRRASQDRVFNNNKTQMVKGYVVDTLDPNITFKVARLGDAKVLEQSGYHLVNSANPRPLPMDPQHKSISPSEASDRMYLYVNKDSQVASFQRGALDIKQLTTSGADLTKVAEQTGDLAAAYTANIEVDILKRRLKADVNKVASTKDTSAKDDENFLVPVFTDTGAISGFRYTMSEHNKDNILNRNNSFETTVGNMEASIEDKVNGRHINEKIVSELKKEFDEGFKSNREQFVFVGEGSTGEFQEMWQMMPAATRRNVERTWGEKGMWIRDDIVELVFGRRKFSLLELTDKFRTSKAHSYALNKLGLDLAKYLNISVGRIENVWQQIVKTVKDTIVIRTISVLVNNVISNINLLVMHQVNPAAILKGHVVAFKLAKEYRLGLETISKARFDIRAKRERISTGVSTAERARLNKAISQLENTITETNEQLATSPVRELNEAGVYQTIVEDVEQEDDQFSYASKIENWVEPVVSKVPDSIKTVGKHLFMAHDTPVYKFLRDATQLSDFVARYTLHEHNLKKGLSKKESIHNVVRSFINYDLPTHRYVQYANDIGLIMFTKFAFRIQRVILETAKGNPASVLALLLLQDIFGDSADITDSVLTPGGVIDRLNLNPLALMATGLTEGATINTLIGD